MTTAGLPLSGLRVLDLSRVLAGPLATQLLADLGADVVKVERPGSGDDTRQWGPPFLDEPGQSAYFLSCNRGKRSLTLDLHHAEARPILDGLIGRADVLIENFLPDSLARLGLEAQRLRTLYPNLVTCSISAFGRTSSQAAVPGYDLMIQAGSGLMSITGEADGRPMKVGVAISDVLTGLYAAASILAGLYARGAGRGGTAFDLALADCTLAGMVNVAQSTLLTGHRPERFGNAHPQIVPYEAFATSDGYIALAIGADRQWVRFCHEVGQDGWAADPRFATNPARVAHRRELVPLVAELLAARRTADWEMLLGRIEVPHSRVRTLDEVVSGGQAAERQMVLEAHDSAGRPYKLLGGAVHWHDEPPRRPAAPPRLGQHSAEVLGDWLGYEAEKIEALRQAGAI